MNRSSIRFTTGSTSMMRFFFFFRMFSRGQLGLLLAFRESRDSSEPIRARRRRSLDGGEQFSRHIPSGGESRQGPDGGPDVMGKSLGRLEHESEADLALMIDLLLPMQEPGRTVRSAQNIAECYGLGT